MPPDVPLAQPGHKAPLAQPDPVAASSVPERHGAGERVAGRGLVPGLASPHPLATMLPGVLRGDDFAVRITEGLDSVLAPVLSTLDCLEAYVDPALAPPDFLEWLTGWVGLSIEEHWPEERRRAFVGAAVELYRQRGTAEGLRVAVSVLAGIDVDDVEVTDSGGTIWSPEGGTPFPGSARASVRLRLRVPDPASFDPARLESAIERNKPAHVAHRVEIAG